MRLMTMCSAMAIAGRSHEHDPCVAHHDRAEIELAVLADHPDHVRESERALMALMLYGVADAATLCREGSVPSSKIYLATEKLAGLGPRVDSTDASEDVRGAAIRSGGRRPMERTGHPACRAHRAPEARPRCAAW